MYLLLFLELKKIRKDLRKGFKEMRTSLQTFVDSVNADFAKVNTALDNIVADETALAAQIADLKTKITGLDADEQAALDAAVVSADALVAKSTAAADSVPDSVPAPVV